MVMMMILIIMRIIVVLALGHKPGQNVSAHSCCIKNPSVTHNDDVSMSLILSGYQCYCNHQV